MCLSILSLVKHHPSPRYRLTFPSLHILALHSIVTYSFYHSLISPGGVLRDWVWDKFNMMRVGLWWENSLIVWKVCWLFYHLEDHLLIDYRVFMLRYLHMTSESCHEYRNWSCMMRVGLWWTVMLDEIVVYFTLRWSTLRLLWSIWSRVWRMIPESWHSYIRWTSIFNIDHLRVWEHDVWDRDHKMGGLNFG